MREIIESGFKVTVPYRTSFRLQENKYYQRLSGIGLKEMDIGWWDNEKGKLIFLELKGIEIWQSSNEKERAHTYLVKSLKEKISDVLLIMSAIWVGTKVGEKLKEDLPEETHKFPGEGNLKFIILIDTPRSLKSLLTPVKDAINRKLAGRVRLFGIKHVTLTDLDTAIKMGLPVTH